MFSILKIIAHKWGVEMFTSISKCVQKIIYEKEKCFNKSNFNLKYYILYLILFK